MFCPVSPDGRNALSAVDAGSQGCWSIGFSPLPPSNQDALHPVVASTTCSERRRSKIWATSIWNQRIVVLKLLQCSGACFNVLFDSARPAPGLALVFSGVRFRGQATKNRANATGTKIPVQRRLKRRPLHVRNVHVLEPRLTFIALSLVLVLITYLRPLRLTPRVAVPLGDHTCSRPRLPHVPYYAFGRELYNNTEWASLHA